MFVFEHYICFYSNVFGYIKKKVIPFQVMVGGIGNSTSPIYVFLVSHYHRTRVI